MSRIRWFDVTAIVLAVAVIVGLGYALRSEETATIAVDPATVNIDRPAATTATTGPSVLFIGDSYTAGGGLPEMSYGCMAAVRMRWLCNLSAVPGTGYVSGGPAHRFVVSRYLGTSRSFTERIPHLAAVYQPDVVVLDGGRNDLFPPAESVYKAMTATIENARRAWPEATIIFIRPRFLADPGNDLGFNDAFITRLRAQPAAAAVVFIDPINRFTGTDTSAMLSDDRIHPNQQGELALTSALVESLVANALL
jgi:lysophospholipase L1-like esterase